MKFLRNFQLIVTSELKFVKALAETVDTAETDTLTSELMILFELYHQSLEIIDAMISREVKLANHAGSLMRANSIASKLMKAYCGLIGRPLLRQMFGPLIEEICQVQNNRKKN